MVHVWVGKEKSKLAITSEMVKQLRQATGAGVLDCRNALEECQGDFDRAAAILREKGFAIAEKKASRVANQGVIGCYVHTGGRVAAMVELNCETDFVARTPEFQTLAHDLAMQVVASKPRWVRREDIPADVIQMEREKYRREALEEGKVERIVDRIVDGRMEKFYTQFCLMNQPYIRDEDITIEELIKQKIAQFGENTVIRRFARFELGEAI